MRILVCSPGLSFQADAPQSVLFRTNGMVDAGLECTVLGYPERYPADAQLVLFDYLSARALVSERQRCKWEQRRLRWGQYWKFIVEPVLVKRIAYKMAAERGYDVVYITHVEPWMMLLLFPWLKLLGQWRPTVATIPGVFYTRGGFKGQAVRTSLRGLMNHVAARFLPLIADVTCNSRFLPDLMGMWRRRRVHVIPEGHRDLIDTHSRQKARQALGIAPSERMLLMFGVASKQKGGDLLLAAMRGLEPRCMVCIVGQTGGVYEPSWGPVDVVKREGWGDRLQVVSRFVSDQEMAEYFAACDGVVIPYRYGHATTSSNLRMASEYGKVVIASDQYLIGEQVKTNGLGLLFPPEDVDAMRACILEFMIRPDSWFEAVRANSRELVSRESWASVGRLYADLFQDVRYGSEDARRVA